MKHLFNLLLEARAAGLANRLQPYLPRSGRVLDIGSGTGHNVQALRQRTSLSFIEADVTDMSVVGSGPLLFADAQLPFATGAFACAILIFVLQYPPDPAPLLLEARRVTTERVIVLHSVYRGGLGRYALRLNEFAWGPVAFTAARLARFVGRCRFSLRPRHFFSRAELQCLFERCGFVIHASQSQPWPGGVIDHDLFVLEHIHA